MHMAGMHIAEMGQLQGIPGMGQLHGIAEMPEVAGMYPHILPVPESGPLDRSAVRKSPAEEEMDDVEEGSEWAVKVGTAPPPIWGKRKASEEADEAHEGNSNKKLKTT
jgi:hypothetical protein